MAKKQKGILSKLSLSSHAQSDTSTDPTQKRRGKLIDAIQTQIAALKAQDVDETYTVDKISYQGDEGNRKKVVTQVPVKVWHWIEGDACYTNIRYGRKVLSLDGNGNNSIQVAERNDLVEVYASVIAAIKAGELDSELSKIAFGKKTAATT